MTATPERTDGFDIFKQFNYQIACEIRLDRAMRENLVCPFHYFGVSDLEINGEMVGDSTQFKNLIIEESINHIHN